MKTTKRVRRFLTATAATVVLAGAGIASVEALDSDGSDRDHEAPALRGGVTDAAVNAWEANDCAVLLAARGENVSPVC